MEIEHEWNLTSPALQRNCERERERHRREQSNKIALCPQTKKCLKTRFSLFRS